MTLPRIEPTSRHAVLYARVSSQEQAKEGFSIPAQDKLLRAYGKDKQFHIASAFTDIETAKRAGRTGFDAMVAYLRKHEQCRILLVEKTDRLYRNFRDWVTIDEIKGLEVHFVKEGAVVSDESRSSEKFIHGIKVLMAKNFIDNLSEETRKGMVEKASQGIWPSYAPIGYLNADGPNGKRTIVPDPALAPLVRRLYELCATGEHSIEELAVIAHNEHLTRGGPIHKSTVNKILRNRVYSGEFEWRGELYEAAFESIVPRDTGLPRKRRLTAVSASARRRPATASPSRECSSAAPAASRWWAKSKRESTFTTTAPARAGNARNLTSVRRRWKKPIAPCSGASR